MMFTRNEVKRKVGERDKELEKLDAELKSKLRRYRKEVERHAGSHSAREYALEVAEKLEEKYYQNMTAHEIRKYSTEIRILLGEYYQRLEDIDDEFEPFEEAIESSYPADRLRKQESLEIKSAKRSMESLDAILKPMTGFSDLLSAKVRK